MLIQMHHHLSHFFISLLITSLSFGQILTPSSELFVLDEEFNEKIDSVISNGIQQKAFPGVNLLVAKDGKIVFHKAYGYHTYDSLRAVQPDDVYDLASVTKILGPLPALMKLYEKGQLDLDVPFSNYWPSWRHKKYKNEITLRELLAHQSGLIPYIVFLNETTKNGRFKKRFVRNSSSRRFSRQAYENLYINKRFERKVFRTIKRSKVSSDKVYRYSGLASLLYPKLIQNLTGDDYQRYLNTHFYHPLGCSSLTYNPREKGLENIVPTEYDSIFRKDLVKGYVHDENAALLGGVSGNAGLFGNAMDLAKFMQLLVQKGVYNGKRYFKEETVEEFTRIQFPENNNRRALGFDKPLIGNDTLSLREAYPAPAVSPRSFGHSGFTGTFVWADPDYDLVFIFLSNRVYPTRNHRNIYNLNIRPTLQQLFYEALIIDK